MKNILFYILSPLFLIAVILIGIAGKLGAFEDET